MGRTRSGGPRFCADRSEAETLNLGFKARFGTETKKAQDFIPELFRFVRKMGLEPTRLYRHKILSLACLPIPALPLVVPQVVYYHLICIKSTQNLKNLSIFRNPCKPAHKLLYSLFQSALYFLSLLNPPAPQAVPDKLSTF